MDSNSQISKAFVQGTRLRDFSARRVTVMGLGRFGGGVGVVNFLQRMGAEVTVTDLASADELAESLGQIDVKSLAGLKLGGHDPGDFTNTDLVVVNPAVKRTNPLLLKAAESGVPLTSEINLFWQHNPARTVAVTGSVGKSTTASLIHSMLSANGLTAHLGGNIGRSLLDQLDSISPADWVVLELSSFQLWDLNHLRCAPEVAVVTNLFPHHLDWHGTFESYADAKASITRWQRSDQFFIRPAADSVISEWRTSARPLLFSDDTLDTPDGIWCTPGDAFIRHQDQLQHISIQDWPAHLAGASQCSNVAAAMSAAVLALRLDPEISLSALKSFSPLPHRRETLGNRRGRMFINDSKATTPEAAVSALREHRKDAGRLLLIAGGAEKGADLQQFVREIRRRVSVVALLGAVGERLFQELQQDSGTLRAIRCESMEEAFDQLAKNSLPGDTILLSPGCASYGEFLNYEQRGEAFRQLVKRFASARGGVDRGERAER